MFSLVQDVVKHCFPIMGHSALILIVSSGFSFNIIEFQSLLGDTVIKNASNHHVSTPQLSFPLYPFRLSTSPLHSLIGIIRIVVLTQSVRLMLNILHGQINGVLSVLYCV